MEKKSNINAAMLRQQIDILTQEKRIPESYHKILYGFLSSYEAVLKHHHKSITDFGNLFSTFLTQIAKQFSSPYSFEPIHRAIRSPFDYYQFGIDFLLPLVDMANSTSSGISHLKRIIHLLNQGDNVILFANHQIEADPQAISILLRNLFPSFAEDLFFVAGTRVTSDPLAIPFSMGRNLICIYSKKYIDAPKEKKQEKQLHNKRTLQRMVKLLDEGGHSIYVAPSGGRDRANAEGFIELAPFDPQSIELFYLMTKKSQKKTHFFTLALSTYHLLPPPEETETTLGEQRITRGGAIHLSFGKEIDMEVFTEGRTKQENRQQRAEYIWNCVKEDYSRFPV